MSISVSVIEYRSHPAVLGFARDITERRRAEEALRKSQELLQSILDYSPAAICVKDTQGRYLLINHRLASIVRLSPAEMLGRVAYELLPPECALVARESDQQVITTVQPVSRECVMHHDDGVHIYLETKFPLYDPHRSVYAVGCISTEITERKRAEKRLLQQERALSMLRERERLARELHDDLGQILSYVNTQTQAIRDALVLRNLSPAEQYLTDLIAVVQDTQFSIREFILGVKLQTVSVQGVIPALQQYIERFVRMYRLPIELTISPALADMVLAPAVEVHLLRIIQEALHNVRKHAAARAVTIMFQPHQDQVQVVIADNGRGFDLSKTADTEPGYGLHSMRSRVDEIKGSLFIETAPGAGTKVMVQVPYHIPDVENLQGTRILLVDDNPLFLRGLQNLLTGQGFAVIGTAHNGEEALEKARSLKPDIILMDVEMPICDGLQATRLLKAELPDIQIVMLTVSEDDEHLFEAIKSGAAGYLLKSLEGAELCDLLSGIAYGEAPLSPGLAARILREFASYEPHETSQSQEDNGKQLTPHEIEVLTLVAQGHTYQEVGKVLNFSERSIKYHMAGIIRRLQLKNRSEAIAYARQKMERGEWK